MHGNREICIIPPVAAIRRMACNHLSIFREFQFHAVFNIKFSHSVPALILCRRRFMTPSRFYLWPVATTLLLSACISKPQAVPVSPSTPAIPAPAEVVHTARYTLVSLTPDDTLRYPLRQIVSHPLVATKKNPTITRGDALHTWLSGTGYGLCLPVTEDMRQLLGSPLPDNQRSPGPLHISDALQLIAGSAWQMTTDEVTRIVCFQRTPQTLS